MKKIVYLFLLSFIVVSCGEETKEDLEFKKIVLESKNHMNDLPKITDQSMSNPELFLGSGFGSAFVSFIKTQNFELALKFTSKESIKKHGSEKIIKKYSDLKTNYNLVRTSKVVNGKYTTIRYTANEYATSKFKDFVVVVENDSCKLVLPENLDDFLK